MAKREKYLIRCNFEKINVLGVKTAKRLVSVSNLNLREIQRVEIGVLTFGIWIVLVIWILDKNRFSDIWRFRD